MSDALLLPLLATVVLLGFRMLGGSRLVPLIRSAGVQGALLALLGLLMPAAGGIEPGAAALAIATAALKGLALPALLLRAMRQVEIRRELEPLVGYTLSLLLGVAALVVAVLATSRVAPEGAEAALVVPVGIFTLFTGFFLMASRRKAISQALGYLVFENGIYALGTAVAHEQPLLVELGILLDLFVAIFVMGIIVFHIQEQFDHIDVDRIASLRDVGPPDGAGR